MSPLLLLILVAAGAVGFMVLGLSITLMRKGHNIQGDVGDNPNMRALGLECTMAAFTDGQVECNHSCSPKSSKSGGCSKVANDYCEHECLSDQSSGDSTRSKRSRV